MKILAIEASGPVAGCALMEDDILRAEYSIQDKMKHSRTLVPMMEEIRSRLELDLAEIHEGDKVSIEFEWDADGALQLEGVVSGISSVGTEKAEGSTAADAQYSAYVDFTPVDSVRLDMSVIVYVQDDGEESDEDE
jgi:hypothetical protein